MSDPLDLPWTSPLGARPVAGGVSFRTWAPSADRVAVRTGDADHDLVHAGYGVHEGVIAAAAGDDYRFVLDGGDAWPDPCSRFQPEGLRGPSRVVDPGAFAWTDAAWRGIALRDAVLYELHVGTFTSQGTFDAAIEHLPALARLGVNAIELMPVADFPGRRGWGYDGVYLHAAHEAYGGPDGLMRLVDAAHAKGIAVVLDLVLNHLGASGATAFEAYGPYFTDRYSTFWGKAINYDDADSDPVREWAIQCAEGWVRDFHLDGLRLDAIHAIYDTGANHVLAELADRVHAANPRALVIAESGLNDPTVMRPRDLGGFGHDAAWADDFHHALRVLLTGDGDGYYADFGEVAQLAKALRRPHVHDGTWSEHRRRLFGAPAFDRPPEQFVVFSQNHDQVGNRAFGDRMPEQARPLAAMCTLLAPFTPMLWMGEEYGEPAPFQFFTDHIDEEIAAATREGRRREFAAFATFAEEVPDPQAVHTFEASRLTRQEAPGVRDQYRALLALRREIGHHESDVSYDEDARWLRVRLGDHELVCNFSEAEQDLMMRREVSDVVFMTDDGVQALDDGLLRLPPLSGAVVR